MGDVFINLSHLILSNIVNFIQSNDERIIFTLICRRFYYNRDRYLCFNQNSEKCFNQSVFHKIRETYNLTSFKDQINRLVNTEFIFMKDDHHSKLDKIEIQSEKKTITIQMRNRALYLPKLFRDRLERSNVDTLYICCSFDIGFEQFPRNIKSITLYSHGCSNDLKWLPESLEKLKFKRLQNISSPMTSTIRYLDFGSFDSNKIAINMLPPQLEVLICGRSTLIFDTVVVDNEQHQQQQHQLPTSLKRLDISCLYVNLLRNLPALKELTLRFEGHQFKQVDIPSTVTSLKLIDIGSQQLQPKALTTLPEIRHLEFVHGEFQSTNDNVLKGIGSEIAETSGNNQIFQRPVVVESLPDDLESLVLNGSGANFTMKGCIYPSSLRSINVNKSFFTINPIETIPITIVTVIIEGLLYHSHSKLQRLDNTHFLLFDVNYKIVEGIIPISKINQLIKSFEIKYYN
ncbi:hypothetical protein PPL_08615 [Heterostelium album PN500]|uniref:Uncharacterized protein n=1 Tax=Heterostelium pallidum (strain ATCC 26659 / Pp 5 / PN500) TaxID=670386 RepID=D3BJ90_HETP5|nr:hypothetical protein PPL_08615 [Heterostelium album PN500]EFA77970.1 hypothetical protein PPL_08615 [Heterostelium album PN500]|eukprot:XP_020430098.1 hypothetical protein PPL_08615 [Heterostelium album PN500]